MTSSKKLPMSTRIVLVAVIFSNCFVIFAIYQGII